MKFCLFPDRKVPGGKKIGDSLTTWKVLSARRALHDEHNEQDKIKITPCIPNKSKIKKHTIKNQKSKTKC